MPAVDQDKVFMDIARTVSTMSYDKMIQVGAVIVKDGNILSCGYNGQPYGFDNETRDPYGYTLPTVVHAELNAILKLAKQGGGAEGATLYSTHGTCMKCAVILIQAGITRHVYGRIYDAHALDFLRDHGIIVELIK